MAVPGPSVLERAASVGEGVQDDQVRGDDKAGRRIEERWSSGNEQLPPPSDPRAWRMERKQDQCRATQ